MKSEWIRYLLLSAILLTATVQAQTISPCATDIMYRLRDKENPAIANAELELQKQITAQLAHIDISKYAKITTTDTEYHIPLVVHVIHDYNENLLRSSSDTNIVKSIARVNELFNKRNADTAAVMGLYKGLIPNSDTELYTIRTYIIGVNSGF